MNVCAPRQIFLAFPVFQAVRRDSIVKSPSFNFKGTRNKHSKLYANSDVFFTETHEWLKQEGDYGLLGITNFAQKQLGEIAFCDIAEVGSVIEKGGCFALIESIEASCDVYMPLASEVVERNEKAMKKPVIINRSPFHEGDVANLLNENQYQELVKLIEREKQKD